MTARRAAPLRDGSERRHWLRRRADALAMAGLALLAALLALGGWGWRVERVFYDSGLALAPRPVPEAMVIVAIDDDSVAAIGRWPWSRAVHATLLQRLAAAKPKAIALDLVLSEPDPDPRQDMLLATAMREGPPVVLPVPWQQVSGQPPRPLEPVPLLREAARLAQADPAPDADGLLRHAFLRAGPAGAPYPHVAQALLAAGGEAVSARVPVAAAPPATAAAETAWQRDGRLLVRYAGPVGHVPRVSYVDVLRGAVPPERFAGRYVLVGMTAAGLGDAQATPVSGAQGAMPGIEVIANVLHTLREGDAVHEPSPLVLALGSALAAIALVAAFGWLPQRGALALALGAVAAAGVASVVGLRWGWWVSPVPFASVALLAYPLWSWQRLEAAVTGIDAEIRRLSAAAGEGALPRPAGGRASIGQRLRTLRAAGELLRVARRFLSTTLDALPAAVLVGDAQARVLLANREAARLFEVDDPAELHGLDLVRLLGEFRTPDAVDWPERLASLVPGTEPWATEAAIAGPDGEAREQVLELAALDDHEGRRLIVTCADIGLVRQAERQREEALAFVSHDLRSPASSIVLLADLAAAGQAPMATPELLAEVRRLAQRTLALSDDFVRAAHVEHQALTPEPAMLETLASQAVADVAAQALARRVTLAVSGSCGEPHRVDRALVLRALGNLLGNAIRHSPDGGAVTVDVSPASVRVRDAGPGLAAERLALLASGRDLGAGRSGDARGVGLGLVFVQRVARRHGGTLQAHNAPEGGAVFELTLPGIP